MRCPLCPDSVLVVSHRHGIEVDHCPTCRGVWLDRGELDHLVESVAERLGPRAVAPPPAPAPAPAPPPRPRGADERGQGDDRWRGDDRARDERRGWGKPKGKRRKHAVLDLLEDVLDL